jgi:hypothetical protein
MEYSMACDAILLRNHPDMQVSRPLQAGPPDLARSSLAASSMCRVSTLRARAGCRMMPQILARGWLSRQDRYDKSDATVRKTLDRGWSATRIVARDQRLRFEDRPDREPPRLFHWFALPSVRRPATRDRDLLLELKPSPFFSPARDANQ